jgi:large subunit ribosomal protein L5
MNRLKEKYLKEAVVKAKKELGSGNVMGVPQIIKISINSGIGPFRDNREAVESFLEELGNISGQRPFPRKAKKSEAGFKIKEGDVVGYAVTLRKERMWAFLDKLINIALPRVRDFRGLSGKAFDKNGNYSLGVREHVIFPEVNPNTTKGIRGLQVTINFNSHDTVKNKYVLENLGFPFEKDDE